MNNTAVYGGDTQMELYQWLSLAAIPVITAGIYKAFTFKIKKVRQDNNAVKAGLQALLRDRLYQFYRDCSIRGSASVEEKEQFEMIYNAYHNLGANGVMDETRKKMLEL